MEEEISKHVLKTKSSAQKKHLKKYVMKQLDD